jgi:ABC-type transporter Mla subunit MlaD
MRLYTQKEANEATAEAKRLQESVNPTIEALRSQTKILQAKGDIVVAQLEGVADNARVQTKVVVAAANTMEVLAEESRNRSAAMDRIYSVASQNMGAIEALLAEDSGSEPESQRLPESGQFFLPSRR